MSGKLDMSLDELIKSTSKKKAAHKGAAGSKRAPLKVGKTTGRKPGQQEGGRAKPQVITVNLASVKRGGVQKGGRGGGRTLPFSQQRGGFAAGGRGGGGRGAGRGMMMPPQQFYDGPPPMGGKWGNDMYFATQQAGGGGFNGGMAMQQPRRAAAPTTTKLFISNLHYNVTEDDIRELFQACGALTEYRVHFDSSGRSLGTAHVIYERPADAEQALRKYNNVALDGSKMKIELVEAPPPPPGTIHTLNSGIHVQVLPETRGGGYGGGRGGYGGGRGPRGRGASAFGGGGGDMMQE